MNKMIYDKITIPSKCHSTMLSDCTLVYVLAMLKGKVVGYLAFKVFKKPIPYIEIAFSCTEKENRRKGLSVILRLVPMILALDTGINLILSDANEMSGPLLVKKFGFTWNSGDGTGDYIEKYGNLVEWQTSPTAYLDMRDNTVKKNTITLVNKMIEKC